MDRTRVDKINYNLLLLSQTAVWLYNLLTLLFTDLPKFGERLQNITVPVGRDAVLICVVDNLQTYKVNLFYFR